MDRVPSCEEQRAVLWDAELERAELVARAAASLGISVVRVRCLRELEVASDGADWPRVALLGLGREPEHLARALDAARAFRDHACIVFTYEDGLTAWPLALRSRVLLAGASRLLDSAHQGFVTDLTVRLSEALQLIRRQGREELALRQNMALLGIVAESRAMRSVLGWVARISQFSDFSVLLQGETGTGKELLARAIHQLDPIRTMGPFVPVNCAALPRTLAESALFGHRRGAFTGADRDRRGLIRAAEGGILFLDEVGELDLEVQAKLLRVLQEGCVLAVGDDRETPVSIRVVTATHRDLRVMVKNGQFREDLLHRLAVLSVELPSLRERREDIRPLVAFLLEKYASLSTVGRIEPGPDFLDALAHIPLPGNVRQLENLVRRAIVRREDAAPLGLHDLPEELWRQLEADPTHAAVEQAPCELPSQTSQSTESFLAAHDWNLARTLASCEKLLVEVAVRRTGGNQSEAARLLGVTPRSVYTKLRKHQLIARPR